MSRSKLGGRLQKRHVAPRIVFRTHTCELDVQDGDAAISQPRFRFRHQRAIVRERIERLAGCDTVQAQSHVPVAGAGGNLDQPRRRQGQRGQVGDGELVFHFAVTVVLAWFTFLPGE
ncbi:MAG: hypothetical protein E6H62_05970 [Betaproteobacteria bacterium]|nr:MAG: hypothetical protein E6H62_05970 [Betaproteobacteria bacterium]